jgi:hypothetical protein
MYLILSPRLAEGSHSIATGLSQEYAGEKAIRVVHMLLCEAAAEQAGGGFPSHDIGLSPEEFESDFSGNRFLCDIDKGIHRPAKR